MTKTETTPAPWSNGDKAAILDWWKQWQEKDRMPTSINLTVVQFERLLEGAIYEIQR